MAITTEFSAQYNAAVQSTDPTPANASDWGGGIKTFFFDFTQGAAAGDTASFQVMLKLPGRRFRVLGHLSRIDFSAFGAARVLDLGHQAYVGGDGVTVALVADALLNGLDVSGAGGNAITGGTGLDASSTQEFDVGGDGIVFESTNLAGTIPAAATLRGYITIQAVA